MLVEKRILRSQYETAFRLGKVSDDRIKLDFKAGSRKELIDQKIHCGLQKPPTASHSSLHALPTNACLPLFILSLSASRHVEQYQIISKYITPRIFFTVCLHFSRLRYSIIELNLDRQSFYQRILVLFGSVFDEISHDFFLN